MNLSNKAAKLVAQLEPKIHAVLTLQPIQRFMGLADLFRGNGYELLQHQERL